MIYRGWPLVKSVLGPPVLVLGGVLLVQIMPCHVLAWLAAWILVSIPLGVLLGHCALSER